MQLLTLEELRGLRQNQWVELRCFVHPESTAMCLPMSIYQDNGILRYSPVGMFLRGNELCFCESSHFVAVTTKECPCQQL